MTTRRDEPENLDVALTRLMMQAVSTEEGAPRRGHDGRERLLLRIAASRRGEAGWITVRSHEGVWRAVKSGVRAKALADGQRGNSVLIELQPGASLPVHRHLSLEEGVVLAGGFQVDGKELGPGDYQMSRAGSRHGSIKSRQGGLAYLRGTSLGNAGASLSELAGALLPGKGEAVLTVSAADGRWETLGEGVECKLLCRDGDYVSRFLRLRPGGYLPETRCAGSEECMLLEGDAFFGDRLVCAGDFHLTPEGTVPAALSSEQGALLFVRSRMERSPGEPGQA